VVCTDSYRESICKASVLTSDGQMSLTTGQLQDNDEDDMVMSNLEREFKAYVIIFNDLQLTFYRLAWW